MVFDNAVAPAWISSVRTTASPARSQSSRHSVREVPPAGRVLKVSLRRNLLRNPWTHTRLSACILQDSSSSLGGSCGWSEEGCGVVATSFSRCRPAGMSFNAAAARLGHQRPLMMHHGMKSMTPIPILVSLPFSGSGSLSLLSSLFLSLQQIKIEVRGYLTMKTLFTCSL